MDGFLNLNKPLGITSHDCVAQVRRCLRLKRVGHGGTLDPLATGVLPIALGRATRLLNFLPTTKRYRATIRFGVQTGTDDLGGDILVQKPVSDLTLTQVQAVLPEFIGVIQQTPPAFSAIHIQGQRAYDLARRGETVVLPERSVEIFELIVENWQDGAFPELTLLVHCRAGTYIRSLARDVGRKLNIPATLSALTRTESGGMDLAHSTTLEQLQAEVQAQTWQPPAPDQMLNHLPAVTLPPQQVRPWCQGQKQVGSALPSPWWRVYDERGCFLGIGQQIGERELKPHIVLVDPRLEC
ncbi:tRNA pseudouridine synthase B [Gloeomargarita lithophora Alchichica-D10]|uniref:tRNA pseudouridine synthase B n=1 Tax=Gloeomargarita lithophora Alchichica-D10 TaxID=1188229 RepID=A0A1J0AGR9_9CYAN|nr:tRNA pseudouridine(55) synthase TruB [Gloeomargarita lithophora]APB35096.1 tRNA pseudouridine synthase B [Gloeomargarita lithophora Alchichica-D10]